jgi:hypothetical protein
MSTREQAFERVVTNLDCVAPCTVSKVVANAPAYRSLFAKIDTKKMAYRFDAIYRPIRYIGDVSVIGFFAAQPECQEVHQDCKVFWRILQWDCDSHRHVTDGIRRQW